MKIRHKLTHQTTELSYHEWEVKYINQSLDDLYEIVEYSDIVLVREIGRHGKRTPFYKFDRAEAVKIIKRAPNKYDYIEIEKNEQKKEEIIIESYKQVENKEVLFDTYFYDYLRKKITRSKTKELLKKLHHEKRIKSLPIDMQPEKLPLKQKFKRFLKKDIIKNRTTLQIIIFITSSLLGIAITAIVSFYVLKIFGLT